MAHLTNFSFELFYKIFTEDASLPLLYHGAKKSKMTKNSNQSHEEMTIVGKYIEEKRQMQYKGDAICKIKSSLGVMHNIMHMRTMILEH